MDHTIPTATMELIFGKKNMVRNKPVPLIPTFSATARSRAINIVPVSYTHLDVYKRQISERAADCSVLEFSLEDPILWWPRPYGEPRCV